MYRLYIDETGSADTASIKKLVLAENRYLSLTGIMVSMNNIRDVLIPALNHLKQEIFEPDPDEPIILHRKEIIWKKYPFHALRDPEKEELFNNRITTLMEKLEYRVFTVVIDKLAHTQKYKVWRHEPYHYCLEILLERYVLFLNRLNRTGDVMAEARGKKHDLRLEKSFRRLYKNGNAYIPPERFQERLTSKNIKMRRKSQNIAGLQFADLIAHPCAMYVRSIYADEPARENFGALLVEILVRDKFHRYRNKIEGAGIKWLP